MHQKFFDYFLLLAVLFFAGTTLAIAQKPEISKQTKDKVKALITDVKKKEDMKGISYAVVNDQKTVMMGGMGIASEKRNLKASPQTNYYLGSITKLFTLTGILRLVEERKINLDDPISTYIPDFSIKSQYQSKNLTIRNVLTHHSGLPSDYLKGCISSDPMSQDSLVKCLQNEYQAHPSGKISSYSNIGFTLLGEVIEQVSGQPYPKFMEQEVLEPLGMDHSYHSRTHPKVKPTVSSGFDEEGEKNPYPMREVPAGGLYTNVEDMTNFIKMIFNKGEFNSRPVLPSSTIEQMFQAQNEDVPLDFDYKIGLTWRLSGAPRKPMIQSVPVAWHSGGTVLFSNMLILLPEQELGVIVMQNTADNGSATRQLANDILRLILQEEYDIDPKEPPQPQPVKNISEEDLQRLSGTYSSLWGYVRLKRKGDNIRAEVMGRTFKLKPYENGKYGLRFLLLGFIPIKVGRLDGLYFSYREQNGEKMLTLHQGGKEYFFAKKFESKLPSDKWLERLGEYRITNLGNDHQIIYNTELKRDGDVLYLSFEPQLYEDITMNMPLRRLNDNTALIIGYGRWQGDRIRYKRKADTTILQYSGLELVQE